MLYKDVEKLILSAIDEGFCALGKMAQFIEKDIDGEYSLDDLLEVVNGMILDRKIVLIDKGDISAYFRAEKIPSKIWRDGSTGKINCEYNGTPLTHAPIEIDHTAESWKSGNRRQVIENPKQNENHKPVGVRKAIDYTKLEKMTAEGETVADICKALDIAVPTYWNRRKEDSEFLDACIRGKIAKKQNPTPEKAEKKVAELKNQTANHSRGRGHKKITDYALVEKYAEESHSNAQLAEKLGLHRNSIPRLLTTDAKFKAAYERGAAKRSFVKGKANGGNARAKKLSSDERQKIAQKAATARWSKDKVFTSPIEAAKSVVDEIIEQTEKVEVMENTAVAEMPSVTPTPPKVAESMTTELAESFQNETPNKYISLAIPQDVYEKLSVVARLENYTVHDTILTAIKDYIEIDVEIRAGELSQQVEYNLKRILEPYTFGNLVFNRDKLLGLLLEAIFEQDEKLEGSGEDKYKFSYTYDLREYIFEIIAKDFVKQLIKEKK